MEVRFVDSELETVIDRVIKYFTEINGIQAAYLFGSFATNRVTAESDIDLAILTNVALDEELLFQIQDTLEGLVGREVDLIDLRNAAAGTVLVAGFSFKSLNREIIIWEGTVSMPMA